MDLGDCWRFFKTCLSILVHSYNLSVSFSKVFTMNIPQYLLCIHAFPIVVGIDHVFASGAEVGHTTTQEWGCSIALRAARSRATPEVVNFHSTMIRTIKPCNFFSRIIRSLISIVSFKSTLPSSENTSLCTRDDVTMVDECTQSTTPSSTHVEKNFQTNIFHENLKAWMDLYRSCLYPGSYLNYVFLICKGKYVNWIRTPP